jgi:4-amino-4-deoxy-L-arabinose transferase-like glycosyltransferase
MHHVHPPWYYLIRLPVAFLPWAGLLPGALWLGWRRRRFPGDRFLLTAAAFIVIVFSLSPEKRDLYVLPAFPALALLAANLVATIMGWSDDADSAGPATSTKWITVGQGIVGGLILIVGLALPFAGGQIHQVPYWTVAVTAAIVVGLGGGTLWFAIRGQPLASLAATVGGTAAVYLFAAAVVLPMVNPIKSNRVIAQTTAAASAESQYPVMAFRTRNLPMALAFYSNGMYTAITWDLVEFENHMNQSGPAFGVLYERDLDDIRPKTMKNIRIIAREPHSSRHVLLVRNRSP